MRFILVILLAFAFAPHAQAYELVRGYIKQNGEVISPYIRSTPNSTMGDNLGR